jgi:uncharacterized membrane protein
MSEFDNPYAPTGSTAVADLRIRKVKIGVIDLYRRTFDLIRDQYWLFLGITLLAMLLVSFFGLIMGNVLVGVYECYRERERRGRTEFETMFKGFEPFLQPFVALLVIVAIGLAAMIPLVIAMFALVFLPVITLQGGGANPPQASMLIWVFLVIYPLIIGAQVLVTLPFVFTFQLLADHKTMGAVDAVKLSVQGVLQNFWGVLWCLLVVTFLSIFAALLCYVPLFLLMPLTLGVFYVMYRDIYGPPPPAAPEQVIDAEVVD